MRFNEITIDEGRHDPHIFKAVFLAGTPGSGKTTIGNHIRSGTGLKRVDVDVFHEWYLKNQRAIDYDRFSMLAANQLKTYVEGRLGLIVDGTGRDFRKIESLAQMLQHLGYDIFMIFVNVSLETAKTRAADRAKKIGRVVDQEFLKRAHAEAQGNIGHFQQIFGGSFVVVDNDTPPPNLSFMEKQVRKFLSTPPYHEAARKWLSTHNA